jgi:large subunit ribosomal protein L16
MGSGKGNPEYWVAVVKPGRIMFEISGVAPALAEEALKRAAMKMPMDCKILVRQHVGATATDEAEGTNEESAA